MGVRPNLLPQSILPGWFIKAGVFKPVFYAYTSQRFWKVLLHIEA